LPGKRSLQGAGDDLPGTDCEKKRRFVEDIQETDELVEVPLPVTLPSPAWIEL